MAGIVISDASPLIGLSIIDGLEWLPKLFTEVWIPEEVCKEVLLGKKSRGKANIQSAIDAGWLKIWNKPVTPLKGIDLDEGETACICLALDSLEPALLIIDERAGRTVAKENDIKIIGTAAIIGLAKQKGYILSARDAFEKLHQSDFRISADVIRTVLIRVGEMSPI